MKIIRQICISVIEAIEAGRPKAAVKILAFGLRVASERTTRAICVEFARELRRRASEDHREVPVEPEPLRIYQP